MSKHINPQTFLCYQRVMVASRMATNAEEWVNAFKEYNSGTYNNQYMVLDMKKVDITPGNVTLKEKSFFIV